MTLSKKEQNIHKLAQLLLSSKHVMAFTGAGISVASGIPSFRGEDGIWSRYDPNLLELTNYYKKPKDCWKVIKEIFYDNLQAVKPNPGHYALTELQQMGLIESIYTQNIDNLHQASGSTSVYEFHGTNKYFICKECVKRYPVDAIDLEAEYPKCPDCSGLVKPDFIFFTEGLSLGILNKAFFDAKKTDLIIIIGCSGEVSPANQIPLHVKNAGGRVVEINPHNSLYTKGISDFKIAGKSQDILQEVVKIVKELRNENAKK